MQNRAARPRNLRLLQAMDNARVTRAALAARAGLSLGTLSMALRRRIDPKPETWKRIADALEVRPEQIIEEARR